MCFSDLVHLTHIHFYGKMRRIYTNNANVEGLLNDNNTTLAKFYTLEDTEPDDYFHTFLVDDVNISLTDYVLTEEQLKAQNPTWCEKFMALGETNG